MAKVLDVDEHTFALLLGKSADYGIREMGLTAIADADVVKVGPKGYIHGWVFVGAPGVGTLVEHAKHGTGKVSHTDAHGHVHVDFGGGKKHSFEHVGGAGPGRLTARGKGSDHVTLGGNASRAGRHAEAAQHYRQAAAEHPGLASEMHARADEAQAKVPGIRPSTASEFARTDISSAIRAHTDEHQDFPGTAKELDALSDGLRDGSVKVPDAANRLDRIVASHVAAHGTDNHTFDRLSMHARDMRSDPRIGQLMKPAPKPRAPRTPKTGPVAAARSKADEHAAAAEDALARGDRAAAINHLMVAANAETDKKKARALRDRQVTLTAQDMGRPVPGDVAARAEADRLRRARDDAKTGRGHIQQALGARMRGQHDEANEHLTAAAALAPDEESRDRLLAARRGGSFVETSADTQTRLRDNARRSAAATSPMAPKPGKVEPRQPKDILADLDRANSREEAHALLEGMTSAQLRQVAHEGDTYVRPSAPKREVAAQLVESRVGHRLSSRAIRGGVWRDGPSPKADASQVAGAPQPQGRREAAHVRPETPQPARAAREAGPARAATPTVDHAALADELRNMPTRQAARDRLEGMKRAELNALAGHLGVEGTRGRNKKELAEILADETVGHRLTTQAYRDWGRTTDAFQVPPGPSPKADASQVAGQADHVQQVKDAYHRLAHSGEDYVPLADIRDQLPHLSRAEQDAALRQVARTPGHHVIPWDDQKVLTQRQRDAGLSHGGGTAHVMRIPAAGTAGGPPAPHPTRAAAQVVRTVPNADEVRSALHQATSTDEAERYIDGLGLKAPELRQLAREAGVPPSSGMSKAQVRKLLVDILVGRRLSGDAIRRHASAPRT